MYIRNKVVIAVKFSCWEFGSGTDVSVVFEKLIPEALFLALSIVFRAILLQAETEIL